MSSVSRKVSNWLYTVLKPQYTHLDIAYRDIYEFLSVYLSRGFRVRTAVYTSTHGLPNLLVNLYGTLTCGEIPVPMNIWIPLNYPFADMSVTSPELNGVPLVFVVPGIGSVLRPGNNLDSSGRFYHPFLSSWHESMHPSTAESEYNLLSLMSCLSTTFQQNIPITHAAQTSGPALPPKPTKNLTSPQRTGQDILYRGPPLPAKPSLEFQRNKSPTPEKYRSAPPLPTTNTLTWPENNSSKIQNSFQNGLKELQKDREEPPPPEKSYSVDPSSMGFRANSRECVQQKTKAAPHSEADSYGNSPLSISGHNSVSNIESLMDQVTIETKHPLSSSEDFREIASKINSFLAEDNPDNLNIVIPRVNETKKKVDILYSQLSHHNKQAAANAANLDKHVKYLSEQVESVKRLNNQLLLLESKNKDDFSEVHVNATSGRIPVNELVVADSTLVHQLYSTAAEIKAYKDTINLVSGTYKSEPELLNDKNIDSCIRSVRALSRDLFWLELTKEEIGKRMGLLEHV